MLWLSLPFSLSNQIDYWFTVNNNNKCKITLIKKCNHANRPTDIAKRHFTQYDSILTEVQSIEFLKEGMHIPTSEQQRETPDRRRLIEKHALDAVHDGRPWWDLSRTPPGPRWCMRCIPELELISIAFFLWSSVWDRDSFMNDFAVGICL